MVLSSGPLPSPGSVLGDHWRYRLPGIFVAIGTGLLSLGPYVELIFAVVVAWTAVMMLKGGGDDDEIEDYSQHLAYRLVKRFFPIWPKLSGHAFLLTQKKWMPNWLSQKTKTYL